MGAAHEAVADHPDVQSFFCHSCLVPPVRVAHRDHRRRERRSRSRVDHHGVGEHAAVPADVLEARVGLPSSSRIQTPASRTMSSLPLGSSGRQWRPVLSCEPEPFTVRVVLRDVEIDGPGAQRVRSSCVARRPDVRSGPVEVFRQSAVFGRVVAEREEHGVRHVGLKAEGLGAVHHFQQFHHAASSCACRPSRFRLRRRAARRSSSAIVAGLAESLGDASWCCRPDLWPTRRDWHAESMRTMPYWRMPRSRSFWPMRAGFAHLREEASALVLVAHGRAAAGGRPDGRHQRSGAQVLCAASLSARRFRSSSVESMSVCGSERNRSTPSNRTPSTSAGGGQIEHGVEIDGRLGVRTLCRPGRATWRYGSQDVHGSCITLLRRCSASGLPARSVSGSPADRSRWRFRCGRLRAPRRRVTNNSSCSHLAEADHRWGADTVCLPNVP